MDKPSKPRKPSNRWVLVKSEKSGMVWVISVTAWNSVVKDWITLNMFDSLNTHVVLARSPTKKTLQAMADLANYSDDDLDEYRDDWENA